MPNGGPVSIGFPSDGSSVAIGEFAGFTDVNMTENSLVYINTREHYTWFRTLGLQPYAPFELSMSSNGIYIATGLYGGGVDVYDSYGNTLWKFSAYPGLPFGGRDNVYFGLSRDSRYLAVLVLGYSVNKPNILYLVRTQSFSTVWSYIFPGSTGNFTSTRPLSVSNDASRISAVVGNTIFMFSNTANRTLWTDPVQDTVTSDYGSVKFSSTATVVSGDGQNVLTINGENMTALAGSTGMPTGTIPVASAVNTNFYATWDDVFALSNDSSTVAMITNKLTVRDVPTNREIFSKATLTSSNDVPFGAALSSDGSIVAVGSNRDEIFAFDRNGNELCSSSVPGYAGYVNVRASGDGSKLVAFDDPYVSIFTIVSQPNWLLIIVLGVIPALSLGVFGFLLLRRYSKKNRLWRDNRNFKPKTGLDVQLMGSIH